MSWLKDEPHLAFAAPSKYMFEGVRWVLFLVGLVMVLIGEYAWTVTLALIPCPRRLC